MKKQSWCHFNLLLAATLAFGALDVSAQSLWKDDSAKSMVADKRAGTIGDIVTILVQENQTASKDQKTATAKSSGIDASIAAFLYGPGASGLLTKGGQYPALKVNSKSDFSGGGSVNQSERITARIAVRVIDVLPNGNLVLEGTRQTAFGGETQDAVLRGVVRLEDVSSANTVFSYNVADASIRFVSKGAVSSTAKKGWFTRAWDKVSPF